MSYRKTKTNTHTHNTHKQHTKPPSPRNDRLVLQYVCCACMREAPMVAESAGFIYQTVASTSSKTETSWRPYVCDQRMFAIWSATTLDFSTRLVLELQHRKGFIVWFAIADARRRVAPKNEHVLNCLAMLLCFAGVVLVLRFAMHGA